MQKSDFEICQMIFNVPRKPAENQYKYVGSYDISFFSNTSSP